jgi:hypothetical protein
MGSGTVATEAMGSGTVAVRWAMGSGTVATERGPSDSHGA